MENLSTNGDIFNCELFKPLKEHAAHLNTICEPAKRPEVFHEIMSGALVWRDETMKETPGVSQALRFIFAYRTSLMLNEPRNEFKPIWDRALLLFPNWVGFHPERRTPTPELLRIYRQGKIRLLACLHKMESEMDNAKP